MIRAPKIKVRPIDYETGEMPACAMSEDFSCGFRLSYDNTDSNGNGRLMPGRKTAFATVIRPLATKTIREIRFYKEFYGEFCHYLSPRQLARIRAALRT